MSGLLTHAQAAGFVACACSLQPARTRLSNASAKKLLKLGVDPSTAKILTIGPEVYYLTGDDDLANFGNAEGIAMLDNSQSITLSDSVVLLLAHPAADYGDICKVHKRSGLKFLERICGASV